MSRCGEVGHIFCISFKEVKVQDVLPKWSRNNYHWIAETSCRVILTCQYISLYINLYCINCTIYSIYCTLYTEQYTAYTVHCTAYTVHCTLYIMDNMYYYHVNLLRHILFKFLWKHISSCGFEIIQSQSLLLYYCYLLLVFVSWSHCHWLILKMVN